MDDVLIWGSQSSRGREEAAANTRKEWLVWVFKKALLSSDHRCSRGQHRPRQGERCQNYEGAQKCQWSEILSGDDRPPWEIHASRSRENSSPQRADKEIEHVGLWATTTASLRQHKGGPDYNSRSSSVWSKCWHVFADSSSYGMGTVLLQWSDVAKLTNIRSEAVIEHSESMFACHGIPEVVRMVRSLHLNRSGSLHRIGSLAKSPPHFTQSNGEAERALKDIQKSSQEIQRSLSSPDDLPLCPSCQWTQTHRATDGEDICTTVPVLPSHLNHHVLTWRT